MHGSSAALFGAMYARGAARCGATTGLSPMKAKMLTASILIITPMLAAQSCQPGWTAAPEGAPWGTRCYRITRLAPSLRLCQQSCGSDAAPVCISSAAEEQFLIDNVILPYTPRAQAGGKRAWLGLYRDITSGLNRCADGSEPSDYAMSKLLTQPCTSSDADCDDERGECATLNGRDTVDEPWEGQMCAYHLCGDHCLCASGAAASPAFLANLDALDAAAERWGAGRRSAAGNAFGIGVGVGLLPSLALLCWWGCRRLVRLCTGSGSTSNRMKGEAPHEGDGHDERGQHLVAAQQSAARRRLRVSFVLVQCGWMLLALCHTPNFSGLGGLWIDAVAGPYTAYLALMPPAIALMFLVTRPIDVSAIRTACGVAFGMTPVMSAAMVFSVWAFRRDVVLCSSFAFNVFNCIVGCTILFPTLPCSCCCDGRYSMPPRAALLRLWAAFRYFFFAFGTSFLFQPIAGLASNPTYLTDDPVGGWGNLLFAFSFITTVALTPPRLRGKLHRWLGALGEAKDADKEAEAATIAALVGGGSAANALSRGARSFRGLPFSSLTEEDLTSNAPAPELHARTVSTDLGEVHGFISHSWRDDGAAKWTKLQEWVKPHLEGEATPLVWLDKACISQQNIERSLACLPVFLSGCKVLVVLAGKSYTSRLWCVMELFVFLRMGGTREQTVVYQLEPGAYATLASFDAAQAQCYLPKDRQHLLAVIEAGMGDFVPFNRVVRGMLTGTQGAAKPKRSKEVVGV